MSRSTIEEELNVIRVKLYEESKNLTLEEKRRRAKERRKIYEEQYGLKFVSKV